MSTRCRETVTVVHDWWECRMVQAIMESSFRIPQNIKYRIARLQSNSISRYIPKRFETCIQTTTTTKRNRIIHDSQNVDTT